MSLRERIVTAHIETNEVDYDLLTDYVAANGFTSEEIREMLRPYVADVIRSLRIAGPVVTPLRRSAKVAAIAEDWQRRLAEVYPTPNGNRRLAEMTLEDVMWNADLLRVQAEKLQVRASGFEALAELMREHGVTTAGDLPTDTLQGWAQAA